MPSIPSRSVPSGSFDLESIGLSFEVIENVQLHRNFQIPPQKDQFFVAIHTRHFISV